LCFIFHHCHISIDSFLSLSGHFEGIIDLSYRIWSGCRCDDLHDNSIISSSENHKNLLIDVTHHTASPLAQGVLRKDSYYPGLAADMAVRRKIGEYRRYFKIDDTRHSTIRFFAVDTFGCLAKEARNFCRLVSLTQYDICIREFRCVSRLQLRVKYIKLFHHYISAIRPTSDQPAIIPAPQPHPSPSSAT
jgi:hypothetical protein